MFHVLQDTGCGDRLILSTADYAEARTWAAFETDLSGMPCRISLSTQEVTP